MLTQKISFYLVLKISCIRNSASIGGRELHDTGSEKEKTRSPNVVDGRDVMDVCMDVSERDRKPERVTLDRVQAAQYRPDIASHSLWKSELITATKNEPVNNLTKFIVDDMRPVHDVKGYSTRRVTRGGVFTVI